MAAADRAINMALRVQGIGDVERDFRRAGDAGEKSFSRIEKAANGAAREVSDYHARLKRVAASARADTADMPDMWKGNALDAARRRNAFVLDRINAEKGRIRSGMPDLTLPGAADGARSAGMLSAALRGVGGAAGIAGMGFTALVGGISVSVAAFNEHERALGKFNATLSYSGNLSGAARGQIEKMAQGVVASTMQTEAAALSAAASLARVPFISKQMLQEALDASARFADAMETDVAQQAEQTGAVLTAIAKNDIAALVKAMEGLNPVVAANVLSLAQAGKTADAQRAYLKALADAVGDGPGGLAASSNKLGDSWNKLKQSIGENFAGPVAFGIDRLADSLNFATDATGRLMRGLVAIAAMPFTGSDPVRAAFRGPKVVQDPLAGSASAAPDMAMSAFASVQARLYDKRVEGILEKPKKPRAPTKAKTGKSEEEREAEQARKAAEQVAEANAKVVESYRLRAEEARERLGLEGAALDAVVRRQAIDADVRRLSADSVEKLVDAKRKEAAFARAPFDEGAARAAATAALKEQTDALREYAAETYDLAEAQRDFNAQQARAQAMWEAVRTPMERAKDELASLADAFRAGDITVETYQRNIRRLAEEVVDAADMGSKAWRGFGDDVRLALGDIAMHGGDAADIIKDLVASVALRAFDEAFGNPIADWIDGLTGNSRDKNVDAVASDFAAEAVDRLGVNSDLAASALGRVAAIGGPIDGLGEGVNDITRGLTDCLPEIGAFRTGLGSVLDVIAGGGRRGGGILGSLLSVGASMLGGGSRAGITNGGYGIKAAIKNSIPGFAGGGSPPIGMPFSVGENGREIMYLLPGGGARVLSGEQSRRAGGFGGTPNINITVIGARGNAEIRQMVSEGVRQGIAGYDQVVGQRVQDNMARRG